MDNDNTNSQGQDNQDDDAPVQKIKTKGASTKFFDQFPEALGRVQQDLNGKSGRLQTLQERNKFLGDQMKMIEGQLKLYSTLNQASPGQQQPVPQELITQMSDLNKEILKNGEAYKQEFNNVKPIPPDPGDNSESIDFNGKNVRVNGDLLDQVKKGNSQVINRVQQMQSSEDPQVREQAQAIGHAIGQGIADQQQTMFKDNGEVSSAPVPPDAVTPGASQPQVPNTPGAPTGQNNASAVDFIKNSLNNNPLSAVAQAGPSGAVEEIRRRLLSNLAQGKK